jgi:cell division protein ZapA
MENNTKKIIRIVNRDYPIHLREGQESAMEKAVSFINARTEEYGKRFHVTDKQDLLAMVSLEIAVKYFDALAREREETPQEVEQKLLELERYLANYLQPF